MKKHNLHEYAVIPSGYQIDGILTLIDTTIKLNPRIRNRGSHAVPDEMFRLAVLYHSLVAMKNSTLGDWVMCEEMLMEYASIYKMWNDEDINTAWVYAHMEYLAWAFVRPSTGMRGEAMKTMRDWRENGILIRRNFQRRNVHADANHYLPYALALVMVNYRPEAAAYNAAGVYNVPAINRAIREGIDPQLLAQMMPSLH